MVIGIFADIHGNALAFEYCLKQSEEMGIDQYIFLGDAVNYYPDVNEVLDLLIKYNFHCILGNHEEMVISRGVITEKQDQVYRLSNTLKDISSTNIDFINTWKSKSELKIAGKKLLLIHGSPSDNLNGYVYPDTDLSVFDVEDYDYVFSGHTHRSMARTYQNTRFINPGSVGMPRDVGSQFSFAIMDMVKNEISIIKAEVPLEDIKSKYESRVHSSVINLLDRK